MTRTVIPLILLSLTLALDGCNPNTKNAVQNEQQETPATSQQSDFNADNLPIVADNQQKDSPATKENAAAEQLDAIAQATDSVKNTIISLAPGFQNCYLMAIKRDKTNVIANHLINLNIEYDENGYLYFIELAIDNKKFDGLIDKCFAETIPGRFDLNLPDSIKQEISMYPDGVQKFGRLSFSHNIETKETFITNSQPIGATHSLEDWESNKIDKQYLRFKNGNGKNSIIQRAPLGNEQTSAQQTDFSNRKPFKYTIRTDFDSHNNKDVEILVSVARMIKNCSAFGDGCDTSKGYYELKYDLDCEGDGEYEYKSLTESKKCIFKRNSGNHQIWVRGDIPVMWLCARKDSQSYCRDNDGDFQCSSSIGDPDDSWNAVISVDDWGDIQWKSMYGFAAGCPVLNKIPNNPPDLSQVKEMCEMFRGALSFNQPLEKWNVSNVTDMEGMFEQAQSFDQPLEKWNVSNVTNMNSMFDEAESFDKPLEKWNVSNVKDMRFMFAEALSFNRPLEKWNVSNVTYMTAMFHHAVSFNQPLEKWNVSNVTDMGAMFDGAESFNNYPNRWIVPAGKSKDMFKGTPLEEFARKNPLKTEKRGN